jgi:hypothetical protein
MGDRVKKKDPTVDAKKLVKAKTLILHALEAAVLDVECYCLIDESHSRRGACAHCIAKAALRGIGWKIRGA